MGATGERISGNKQWIAMLLCSTAAIAGVQGTTTATAQTRQSSVEVVRSATIRFDIPAGPVSRALTAWAQVAGLKLLASSETLRGVQTAGVSGALSREQALRRLLAGSGLTYRFSDATTVAISRPGLAGSAGLPQGAIPLDTIDVQGAQRGLSPEYAGGQVATGGQVGILGNVSVMNTPFNQTNYTAKRIQNTQAQTVRDAIQDDPSVRLTGGESLSIRGFGTSPSDFAYGGLYGLLPAFNAAGVELAERVEVLKGPSALLYGMPISGSIGGTVNVVPKRAGDTPLTQITTNYRSDSRLGGNVDIGRRFGANKEFGVRFNGGYTDGDTVVDGQSQRFGIAVLGLDYRGDRLRLSADLGYQDQRIRTQSTQGYVLSPGLPIPEAPNGRVIASQPWTYSALKSQFGVVRGEFDITDGVMVYGAYGRSRNDNENITTGLAQILDTAGTTASSAMRSAISWNYSTAQAGIRAKFDTGPVKHQLTVEASRVTQDYDFGNQFDPTYPIVLSNLYNPIPRVTPNLSVAPTLGKIGVTELSGLSIADTLSFFDDRILLTGGVRKQYVTQDSYNYTTNALTGTYKADALSPAVAIVVKPWQNVSLYANYIEGLTSGMAVPTGYANAGAILPPYQSKQKEAGVKIDWGRITTTFSAFEISKPSVITIPGPSLPTLSATGEQINRGVEFNFFGEVTPALRLLGGAMFLDPRLAKTQNGVDDGKIAVGTPRFQANLGVEWDTPFIPGFTLTGRMVYTGAQYYETAQPLRSIPEWTRFDLGARYTFVRDGGQPITVRFAVENVANANYWVTSPGALYPGAPRTFALSTTFNF